LGDVSRFSSPRFLSSCPLILFMGFCLCTTCSCISSRHISFACALVVPKAKFLNLVVPSSLYDWNRGILISRWPNQFKAGDTNSSTSRTKSLLNLINMGLPPLMPAKV
jgi:hypothetical protein